MLRDRETHTWLWVNCGGGTGRQQSGVFRHFIEKKLIKGKQKQRQPIRRKRNKRNSLTLWIKNQKNKNKDGQANNRGARTLKKSKSVIQCKWFTWSGEGRTWFCPCGSHNSAKIVEQQKRRFRFGKSSFGHQRRGHGGGTMEKQRWKKTTTTWSLGFTHAIPHTVADRINQSRVIHRERWVFNDGRTLGFHACHSITTGSLGCQPTRRKI